MTVFFKLQPLLVAATYEVDYFEFVIFDQVGSRPGIARGDVAIVFDGYAVVSELELGDERGDGGLSIERGKVARVSVEQQLHCNAKVSLRRYGAGVRGRSARPACGGGLAGRGETFSR